MSPAEVQAIAEEGFVCGLPLVMNYAVMNAFSVNRAATRHPWGSRTGIADDATH